MKKDIQKLLSAYETDVADLHGMGRFEVANLLTNRDILEENKSEMTTEQSARLLFADEKLIANWQRIIEECGGKEAYATLRQHNPPPAAWWWYLDQIEIVQRLVRDEELTT